MRAFLLPLVALGGARAQSVRAPTAFLLPSSEQLPRHGPRLHPHLDGHLLLGRPYDPLLYLAALTLGWFAAQSCDSAQFQAVTLVVNDLCCQGSACSLCGSSWKKAMMSRPCSNVVL